MRLQENTNDLASLSRRLRMIDVKVDIELNKIYHRGTYITNKWAFLDEVVERIYDSYFDHLSISEENGRLIYDLLEDYVQKVHGEKIDEFLIKIITKR
jgi:hypothetical protein